MRRTKLLDLFCGAGGCSVGYHRAGFEVTGVDLHPQPRYPFRFIQADAITFPLEGFDVIHASPPCQRYSLLSRGMKTVEKYPDVLPVVADRLRESGLSYVIENVPGAPLIVPLCLCGTMFGLGASGMHLIRHRLFETRPFLLAPPCQHPPGLSIGVYGQGTNKWHRDRLGRCVTEAEKRDAMGIDWMSRKELSQAIPPAYTEWIGRQLMEALRDRA